MKQIVAIGVIGLCMASCSNDKERYLDLTTGRPVEVIKDERTGYMVNKESGEPLYIYVDTKKDDTIYARTGEVINGQVKHKGDKWIWSGDEKLKMDGDDVKYKDGDYKIKVESDGDIKIKDGDKKIKIDDGERKVKND